VTVASHTAQSTYIRLEKMLAVLLPLLLSVQGAQKGTLSPSGVMTAFVVGYGSLSGGLWGFGVTLIGFYMIGSRATKCKFWNLLQRGRL